MVWIFIGNLSGKVHNESLGPDFHWILVWKRSGFALKSGPELEKKFGTKIFFKHISQSEIFFLAENEAVVK